jgi:peptidyl-prolyl cis-trans isomerase D
MPDTVKVRHILIGTTQRDPQTGQSYPIRDTTVAYNLADSLRKAIAGGSNFDSLVVKFSDDPGSKDKGGVYESVPSGQMVPAFNDFIFLNPVGTKGVVKTDFGSHYIEILSQKGGGAGYKIAYLPKEIIASQETDNAAQNAANQFAGDSPDGKAFGANYEKQLKPKGILNAIATDIKPVDADIRGLGNSRALVRNIFEAKKGEVLRPERVGDNYIVAIVTDIFEEGTQSVARARLVVEPILRNKKKAEMLKKKVGNVTTLEAAATALGGKQIEPVDSLRMNSSMSPALGYEPKVTGAVFNPANKGKVVPEVLEGSNGVYVVQVNNVTTTPVTAGSVEEQRKAKYEQGKQFLSNPNAPSNPVTILRQAATIKDNRAKIY